MPCIVSVVKALFQRSQLIGATCPSGGGGSLPTGAFRFEYKLFSQCGIIPVVMSQKRGKEDPASERGAAEGEAGAMTKLPSPPRPTFNEAIAGAKNILKCATAVIGDCFSFRFSLLQRFGKISLIVLLTKSSFLRYSYSDGKNKPVIVKLILTTLAMLFLPVATFYLVYNVECIHFASFSFSSCICFL